MFNPLFETLHLDISDLLTSPSLSEKIIYLFIERRIFLSDFNQMFCPAIIDRRADGEVACLPATRAAAQGPTLQTCGHSYKCCTIVNYEP